MIYWNLCNLHAWQTDFVQAKMIDSIGTAQEYFFVKIKNAFIFCLFSYFCCCFFLVNFTTLFYNRTIQTHKYLMRACERQNIFGLLWYWLSCNTNDHLLWQCVGERQTDRIYFMNIVMQNILWVEYVKQHRLTRIYQSFVDTIMYISIHSLYFNRIFFSNSFFHICFRIGRHPHRIVLFL